MNTLRTSENRSGARHSGPQRVEFSRSVNNPTTSSSRKSRIGSFGIFRIFTRCGPECRAPFARAFTLVELLIVISIIAVLAALIFPAVGFVKKRQLTGKAQAELKKLTIAIEGYKTKFGQYPPDNNGNTATKYWVSPLYFELVGTTGPKNLQSGGKGYETLDGSAQITLKVLKDTYNVDGLVNVTRGGGDEGSPAKPFIQDLKADQYGPADLSTPQARVLACTVGWPPNLNYPLAGNPGLNPWQYNSSNPTNNTGSYDLWVDILIAGKTNRISNWSKVAQIVK